MFSPSTAARLSKPLKVGPVEFANRIFLAPMSGITDRPFREMAARFGAGMVVSEMVAGGQLVGGDERTRLRAESTGHGHHVVQLAGREPDAMAAGARAAAEAGADIIDINMGCPAKKVTSGLSGSALMRNLDHATSLIEATVRATDRPVTLKMRLGWDDNTKVAPELARRAEACGVVMVTVHGRTRCQFYTGAADWAAIRAVKDAVAIPVIANGDLVDGAAIDTALRLSGADGVMIGRAACGRPWWPGTVATLAGGGEADEPAGTALHDLVCRHYEATLGHYGVRNGLRVARKHLGWYLDRHGNRAAPTLRGAILRESEPAEVLRLLADALAPDQERMAA